jgi:hypothetical protein
MVRTWQDIYLPGEKVELKLARITEYPVGLVSGFSVIRDGQLLQDFSFDGQQQACIPVKNGIDRTTAWTVPADFRPAGRVQLRLRFCDKQFPEMPDQIESNVIQIRSLP